MPSHRQSSFNSSSGTRSSPLHDEPISPPAKRTKKTSLATLDHDPEPGTRTRSCSVAKDADPGYPMTGEGTVSFVPGSAPWLVRLPGQDPGQRPYCRHCEGRALFEKMAPAGRCFTQEAAIQNALDHFRTADACVLSEHYHASASCEASLYLLATSFYRNNEVHRCLHAIKKNVHLVSPRLRLLQARCCVDLKQYAALPFCVGIATDVGIGQLGLKRLDELFGDLACEVLALLGRAKRMQKQRDFASQYYQASVERNPFIWSAFEGLCYSVADVPNVASIFTTERIPPRFYPSTGYSTCAEESHPPSSLACRGNSPPRPTNVILQTTDATPEMFSPDAASTPGRYEDLCGPVPSSSAVAARGVAKRILVAQPQDATPLGQSYPASTAGVTTSAYSASPPVTTQEKVAVQSLQLDPQEPRQSKITPTEPAPAVITKSFVTTGMRTKYAAEKQFTAPRTERTKQGGAWNPPAGRKLFIESASNSAASTPAPLSAGPVTRSAARRLMQDRHVQMPSSVYGDRPLPDDSLVATETPAPQVRPPFSEIKEDFTSTTGSLMDDLRSLAAAVANEMTFKLQSALSLFEKLPTWMRNTSYVLRKTAKAYFEIQRYTSALKAYKQLAMLHPYCIDGMDTYSSCLWQLNDATALSSLANKLNTFAPYRPETLCAAGNSASLSREPETAVQFFEKAVKADESFPYAHSLLGSELCALRKFDESTHCFRTAIEICPRHYNAWFGLGLIAFQKEDFVKALQNFGVAFKINGSSSVVLTHVGLAFNAQGNLGSARRVLQQASRLNRLDPLPVFHLASLGTREGKFQDAIKLLEIVKKLSPKEALVNYLLGKIYMKLGKVAEARTHLAWASSVDPKNMSVMVQTSLGNLVSDSLTTVDTSAGDSEDEEDERVLSGSAMMSTHESISEDDGSSFYDGHEREDSQVESSINDMSL